MSENCADTRRTTQADSAGIAAILALLGIVLQDVNAAVGLDCSPITVIGVGTGNSCSANVVCCQNNNVVRIRFLHTYIAQYLTAPFILKGWPHLYRLRPGFALSGKTSHHTPIEFLDSLKADEVEDEGRSRC